MTDPYHHSYSDYLKTNYTTARFPDVSSSYLKYDQDILNRYSFRENELLNKLELKNEEIYKLRVDLENEIKAKENLLFDLNQVENELEYVRSRSIEQEQALNSKIRILEIEKNILEEKSQFRDTRNNFNIYSDKKLDEVVKFLNNIQKIVFNPIDQRLLSTNNLTENILNDRLQLLQSEIQRLAGPNNKNVSNLENVELINLKLKELKEDNDKLSKRIQELYEVFPTKDVNRNPISNSHKSIPDREMKKYQKEKPTIDREQLKSAKKGLKSENNSNVQRSKSKEKPLFYPSKERALSKK